MREHLHFAPSGDFSTADLRRVADALAAAVATRAVGPHELFVCEPGELPRRTTRDDAAEMMRAGGLSSLARRIDRLLVPSGTVAILALSDARPPSLRLLPVAALPPAGIVADDTPPPVWASHGGRR